MKKLLIAALGVGLSLQVAAQQRPQYSQYMMNNYLLNPAMAGVEDFTDVKLGMRRQWVGLEGAPITYYASAHTSFGKKDRQLQTPFSMTTRKGRRSQPRQNASSRFHKVSPHHGVGAMIELDQMGPLASKGFHVTYAYHQPISSSIRISLGLSTGLRQFSLDREKLTLKSPIDPMLFEGQPNRSNFDLAAGAWLYAPNFYVGFSGQQLLKNDLDFSGGGTSEGFLQRHFFGTAGVKLAVSEDFAFVPSVMVKMADPAPTSVDINLKGVYVDAVWAGISYRQNDAVSVMAGGNVTPRLSVGYSYDFTTSELNKVSSGSHEIVLGLRMGNPMDTKNWLPWW